MPKANSQIIAMHADVTISAAESEGEVKGPPRFDVLAYTGGELRVKGFDLPVVVDLNGLQFGRSLIANLDHNPSQRVGHVTDRAKQGGQLRLGGLASAATPARDEVIHSARDGFVWQASIEALPTKLKEVPAGRTAEVNGQKFHGPIYVATKSTLKGFAFVSHGADDNTSVTIAAAAASDKESFMDPEFKKWIEAMLPGTDVEDLSEQAVSNLQAQYDGRPNPVKKKRSAVAAASPEAELEEILVSERGKRERASAITQITATAINEHPHSIEAIEALARLAIEGEWETDRFELELLRATRPQAHTVYGGSRDKQLTNQVIEAAICMAGRLENLEDKFSDQVLQAAHDRFRSGIGLKQVILLAAESNGYRGGYSGDVTLEAQRAAFGMIGPQRQINASFSTLSIATVLSNVGNKFLMEGWNHVDLTPLRIAYIKPVNDFKEITTVSLTGDLMFEQVGAGGELKHGKLGERTYTNKADTYGKILSITRQDIINDDLGALTATPKKLGRGGALKLNDIFWRAFLDNASFFSSGNANVSTVDGTLGLTGLSQAETIFMSQTDPDGNPLGSQPAILLVPTALKTTALQLMNSERLKGDANEGDANPWRGRFRVESSPYMSNSNYTGYSAVAWYLLADPNDLPVIEIVALKGRVEPYIETTDADFNVLGIQMRGYSDVGVRKQEHRGGVRADGSGA